MRFGLPSVLEKATCEEVVIKRAIDDCHQVSRLHGVKGFAEVLASEVRKVHLGPSSIEDAGELLKLYRARACRVESSEGFAVVYG